MKKVKVCYSVRNNIGDAINPIIIERVLGYEPEWADSYHCCISGIGSGLRRFFYDPKEYSVPRMIGKEVKKYISEKSVFLWSAGFISTPGEGLRPCRRVTVPMSVRGKLSLKAVESALGEKYPHCVTGDAGILAAQLIRAPFKKQYKIGIIPHDNERDEVKYKTLCNNTQGSILIDVRDEPIRFLEQMAQCETIVSSSLHGLIIADGFGIPNRQIKLTNKLAGDGFKFRDYYSAYDVEVDPLDISDIEEIGQNDIWDHYRVKYCDIKEKQEQLIESFMSAVDAQK